MQTDYREIQDTHDLALHLLSISYLYGDYAIPFHFMNPSSQLALSIKKDDFAALQRFASRNWIDFESLSDEKRQEIDQIYEMIKKKYGDRFKKEIVPLPPEYLRELGERALRFGRFRDAHSAFTESGELDKRVNQFVTEAVNILQSKELTSGDMDEETFKQKVAQAADLVFRAVKLKNPFGNQFQKLGIQLHYQDSEALRKYSKYLDQTLFKEIIEFAIHYLIDDRAIADKVTSAISSGKLRREFLRQLAIRFAGGEDRYQKFIKNYKSAIEKLKQAETEKDFLDVQKTLLGRGAGDNEYFQVLEELCLEHPLSALLVVTQMTPGNKPFIAPMILKSGTSLLEFLELS